MDVLDSVRWLGCARSMPGNLAVIDAFAAYALVLEVKFHTLLLRVLLLPVMLLLTMLLLLAVLCFLGQTVVDVLRRVGEHNAPARGLTLGLSAGREISLSCLPPISSRRLRSDPTRLTRFCSAVR